jgi:glyoxylase I family protein
MFHSPHVILFSNDVSRAVSFFTGLGFTETFRVPSEGEPIHVDLVLDGYTIGIASVGSTREDHGLEPVPEGQRAAVILWTEDTRRAYAELTAQGVLLGAGRRATGCRPRPRPPRIQVRRSSRGHLFALPAPR